jgi:hypothetical protein
MNPTKKLAFLLLITALAGVCSPPAGQATPPGNKLYTLYPPLNIGGGQCECCLCLQWQKPQTPGGTTPVGLVGYYVYRNGIMIHYCSSGETLTYFECDMDPSTYNYQVTANYDLTTYGFPGQFGESSPAGSVTLAYNCASILPFYEPWDAGTFSFAPWYFIPTQSNWIINTTLGNPAPIAEYTGTPAVQNYEVTMMGQSLSGKAWICANIYLDFDYKLTDNVSGGTEKLIAEYYMDSIWYPIYEITNQGSTGWLHQKIDISQVCGHYYRIGFKVAGQNSTNIDNWQLDNIHVYAICKGPENLAYSRIGQVISLTWQPPLCDSLQGLSGYNVYRTNESGLPPYMKLNSTPVAGQSFDDHIPANTTSGVFRYYITAIQKELNTGSLLCEVSGDTIAVDYALGIKVEEKPGIRVSPQPAKNYLTVSSPSLIESCELFNTMGERVQIIVGEKRMELTIPVSALQPGIYLVKIKNAAGTSVQKVSVLR